MNRHDLRSIILEELAHDRHVRKRKLNLADYLNESSKKNLLEINDDTIISTGSSFRELNEGSDNPDPFSLPDEDPASDDTPANPGADPSTTAVAANNQSDAAPEANDAPTTSGAPGADQTVSTADTVVDDPDSFEPGQVPAPDGTDVEDPASSIMNTIIAGARAEDAARASSRSSSAGTEKNPVIPAGAAQDAVEPVEPPEIEPNVKSFDKKSISRYLDRIARGEIGAKLTESKTFKKLR